MNGAASFWKHKGRHGGFNQRRLEGDEAAAEEAGGGEASWSYSRAATSSRSRRRSRRRRRWWNRGGGSCSTRLMRARELKQDVTISHRVCNVSASCELQRGGSCGGGSGANYYCDSGSVNVRRARPFSSSSVDSAVDSDATPLFCRNFRTHSLYSLRR